jgi:hypothetical protein
MRCIRCWTLIATVALTGLLSLPAVGTARADGGAQLELTLLGGAGFRRSLPTEGISTEFDPGWNVGGMLGVRPGSDWAQVFFVSYQLQRSPLQVSVDTRPDVEVPVFIHLVHAGIEADGEFRPWLLPFLGASLGATGYQPARSASDDVWFFSVGVHGGVKVPIRHRLGLRLQGRVLTTVMREGKDIFCSNQSGTCIGSDDDRILISGDAAAGFYFVF